jgi:hypothetical protein
MEVKNCVGRQPLRLVGVVANKILAADEQRIPSNLERVGDRIIDAGFDSVAGDGRDSIARQNLDITVGIGEGTVGADLQGIRNRASTRA